MKSLLPIKPKLPTNTKIAVTALVLASLFLPSPFVILSPGNPQNILGSAITITGTKSYPTTGKLSVTSVMVTDPDSYITGFDVLYGWFDKNRAVLPRVEVYPEGESAADSMKNGAEEMSGSQTNATAAALNYLGYKSTSKLVITEVNDQTNANKLLYKSDIVLSVDDKKFESASEIMRYLDQKQPGDLVSIKVLRSEREIITKQIKLSARDDGSAFIGVNIQQNFNFPFQVKIQLAETGGPSGGLVFALGVVEKLTPADLIRGRNIAGTGTITADGQVGPIGGIAEKIIGAKKDGVKIFLAPIENCTDIKNKDQLTNSGSKNDMKIVPVATLTEAISVLNLPADTTYPSCATAS
ncbi:MAG: S16 family serine protease [Actinomycetes bacterium]|jgi:Lon-like protease